jgi:hypothetical protein
VLIVGGHPWARAIGEALQAAGVRVRLWTGRADQQDAARTAGLDADRGRLMVDALSREAELEEVTDALVLTGSDDFNALAAAELRIELGHGRVHRVAPAPETDLLPPVTGGGVLGGADLTFEELTRRFASGERLVATPAGDEPAAGPALWGAGTPLFAVTPGGRLRVAADGTDPAIAAGDTVIALAADDAAARVPAPAQDESSLGGDANSPAREVESAPKASIARRKR